MYGGSMWSAGQLCDGICAAIVWEIVRAKLINGNGAGRNLMGVSVMRTKPFFTVQCLGPREGFKKRIETIKAQSHTERMM